MIMLTIKRARRALSVLLAVAAVSFGGCAKGPKTHAVKGNVTLDGGDVALLAGHSVEAVLESDPAVRAAGVIQKDGTFTLVSLLQGEMRHGAVAGKYKAKIVLSDDPDETGREPARPPLAKHFYQVETSGLSFVVGDLSPVQLSLSARAVAANRR